MKNRKPSRNGNGDRFDIEGPKPMPMKKKKNMNRLGGTGTGLSLQAFANAKSTTNHYNPALIKKKREFYKNAKYVNKYKKSIKQQGPGIDLPSASRIPEIENENMDNSRTNRKNKKRNNNSQSLRELYEKQWEEKEKARMEMEAIIQAKKEQKEKAEAQRKAGRKEMFKKTQHGQPIMKYRIQHILQSLQSSSTDSVNKD